MNFINELINNPMFVLYFSFVNFALTIIAICVSMFCINKYKKLNLRYEKFMRKLGTGEKIEEILSEILDEYIVLEQRENLECYNRKMQLQKQKI